MEVGLLRNILGAEEMGTKQSRKGDIFRYFKAINDDDYAYIDRASKEGELDSISPFVVLMWMNGAEENQHIHNILTSMYASQYVFSLSKHSVLLHKLMVASNSLGDDTRYKFRKANTTTTGGTKEHQWIAEHYNCSIREAKEIAEILSKEEIKELEKLYGG